MKFIGKLFDIPIYTTEELDKVKTAIISARCEDSYRIVASNDGIFAGIKHLECGKVSWNSNDVKEKYCGNCHKFL